MAMSTVTHSIINLLDVKIRNLNHSTPTVKSVYFQSETLNHLTQFATATFNKGDMVEEHSHQTMNELFYVEYGRLILEINGKEDNIEKGSVFIVYAKSMHKLEFVEETKLIYFGIKE